VPNRTTAQIVADMLHAASESGNGGIGPTRLAKRANVPHPRLQSLTKTLVGAGLIVRVEAGARHTFAITPKGRHYLEIHVQYHSMAESFGLEL